ncbi:hypothetical protein FA95DRAFT_399951 [Auriscalpium vulgare]|uniref:Uncharacterized protein n=1 Tax=Auriscalpium vulgare TaxID=40419 RepID=A0ACB8RI98_9AGAM|nr:hypothetical protein FA95DRAFT_399951 [Auriscalpium vulgare]
MALHNFAQVAHGPILIGTIFNTVLYGISIAQTFMYFQTYKNDRLWMKLVVLFVFVADTLNSVFDIEYTYNSLVNHYNDPGAIQKANWVFATDPAMTAIIGTVVQLFFSWRVHVLTHSNLAVGILVVGAIISGLGGVATSIAIGMVPMWLDFQKFKIPVIVWLTVSALVDSSITAILVWHLRGHKRGFKASDDILDRIIRLTVQTGMITSIWAIVDLAVYLSIPTGVHLIFNFALSKLYSNSLLSSLNSRGGWKYGTQSGEESSSAGNRRPDVLTFGSSAVRPEVFIDVESHEMAHADETEDKKTLTGSTPPPPRPARSPRPTSAMSAMSKV